MFTLIRSRLDDARTLAALCNAAEQSASDRGSDRPGSEHYVLAALGLADGTARAAFALLDLDAARFTAALDAVHRDALASLGVHAAVSAGPGRSPEPRPPAALFASAASGEVLVQRLAAARRSRPSRPLCGADVLLAAAEEEHSLAARAFRALGISRERLAEAAHRMRDGGGQAPAAS